MSAAAAETWLPVTGFERFYEVSNTGRVRSLPRLARGPHGASRRLPGRLLKCHTQNDGYVRIGLRDDRNLRQTHVHVLVAEAFIGPRPAGLDVAHNDGNPSNNRVENLRYATRRENLADTVLHGTHNRGTRHHQARLTEADVLAIRSRATAGEKLYLIAEEFGIHPRTAGQIAHGERWSSIAPETVAPRRRRRATETHCANGHLFTPETTFTSARVRRGCRTCRREATLQCARRRRAAA